MTVRILHGWNSQGRYADTMVRELIEMGVDADDFDYGWHLFGIDTRMANRVAARALNSVTKPGDILIAHSNGAPIVHRAILHHGCAPRLVILISPALDRKIKTRRKVGWWWAREMREYPSDVEKVYVFATPHDWVLSLARLVPWSYWGDMGRVGYRGSNPLFKTFIMPKIRGHSEWFVPENRPRMLRRFYDIINGETP